MSTKSDSFINIKKSIFCSFYLNFSKIWNTYTLGRKKEIHLDILNFIRFWAENEQSEVFQTLVSI